MKKYALLDRAIQTLEKSYMTEEQVTLEAIQQYVDTHALKDMILANAQWLRERIKENDAMQVAIYLVGAELAAQS